MTRTPVMLSAVAAGVAVVAGCAQVAGPTAPNLDVPATTAGPMLLVNNDADGYFEALVSGVLAVSAQGCVTLDDVVVSAPAASTMNDEAGTLHVTGYPTAVIGETVRWSGGYEELDIGSDEVEPRLRDCAPSDATTITVVAVAPGPA